jgi:hypothetical protein
MPVEWKGKILRRDTSAAEFGPCPRKRRGMPRAKIEVEKRISPK